MALWLSDIVTLVAPAKPTDAHYSESVLFWARKPCRAKLSGYALEVTRLLLYILPCLLVSSRHTDATPQAARRLEDPWHLVLMLYLVRSSRRRLSSAAYCVYIPSPRFPLARFLARSFLGSYPLPPLQPIWRPRLLKPPPLVVPIPPVGPRSSPRHGRVLTASG